MSFPDTIRGIATGFLTIALCINVLNAADFTNTPVERNGALKVIGTNLCNQYDEPVQLRGLSTHGIQWFHSFYDNGLVIEAMAKEWGVDVMRLSLYVYEEGYLANSTISQEQFKTMMDTYVDYCTAAGIYAIIDWHVHLPGDPNYSIEAAREFFGYMSQKHADKNNVIYEICNEPNEFGPNFDNPYEGGHYVEWWEIAQYANDIIPIIRNNAPNSVIIVGTPSWGTLGISNGRDWHEVTDNQLDFPNVLYTFHIYAAVHSFRDEIAQAAQVAPLFCSEWAACDPDWEAESWNDVESANAWMQTMRDNNISWTYWNLSNKKEWMAIFDTTTTDSGPFAPDGENVTESGALVYNWLTEPEDAWGDVVAAKPGARQGQSAEGVLPMNFNEKQQILSLQVPAAAGPVSFSIFDPRGRSVVSREITGAGTSRNAYKVSLPTISGGLYYGVLKSSDGEIAAMKFMIR